MSTVDHVTDFKLGEAGTMAKITDLIAAINSHFAELAKNPPVNAAFDPQEGFESFCCSAAWDDPDARIPNRFRWLVAFAVEGENEADYVHIGALIQRQSSWDIDISLWGTYVDFGFAKLWGGPARAREVANEVQRFLNDARWN